MLQCVSVFNPHSSSLSPSHSLSALAEGVSKGKDHSRSKCTPWCALGILVLAASAPGSAQTQAPTAAPVFACSATVFNSSDMCTHTEIDCSSTDAACITQQATLRMATCCNSATVIRSGAFYCNALNSVSLQSYMANTLGGPCTDVCRSFAAIYTNRCPKACGSCTPSPTTLPTLATSTSPTVLPTAIPTTAPTVPPTAVPTTDPTGVPTFSPSRAPTQAPATLTPTSRPPTRLPTSPVPTTAGPTTARPTPTPSTSAPVAVSGQGSAGTADESSLSSTLLALIIIGNLLFLSCIVTLGVLCYKRQQPESAPAPRIISSHLTTEDLLAVFNPTAHPNADDIVQLQTEVNGKAPGFDTLRRNRLREMTTLTGPSDDMNHFYPEPPIKSGSSASPASMTSSILQGRRNRLGLTHGQSATPSMGHGSAGYMDMGEDDSDSMGGSIDHDRHRRTSGGSASR